MITLDTAMAGCIILVWLMLAVSIVVGIYALRTFRQCLDILHYVLYCYEEQEGLYHEGTD